MRYPYQFRGYIVCDTEISGGRNYEDEQTRSDFAKDVTARITILEDATAGDDCTVITFDYNSAGVDVPARLSPD